MFSPVVVILRSPETATVETTPSLAALPPNKLNTLAEHAGKGHLITFFLLHLGLSGCGGKREGQHERGN